MLNKNLYTCLLLAAVLLLAKLSFGQCATNPSLYTTLPVGVNGNVTLGSSVCPSTTANSSINYFSVPAVIIDAGDPADNTFEWAVYGGWITEINGAPTSASQLRTAASTRYSCLSVVGVDASFNSTITVVWDTTNYSVVPGWVAVRQTSKYGCSEGLWSVYTNDIKNDAPVYGAPITDIHLPYDYDLNNTSYTLPVPSVTDDGCRTTPLTHTVTVVNGATTVFTGSDAIGDHTTDLLVGTNVVTWTAFDGARSVSQSYNIIIDADLSILHVAWNNPYCGTDALPATNGFAMVTEITPSLASYSVEYSFDEGQTWGGNSVGGLDAGEDTVRARIIYPVDTDGDGATDGSYTQTSADYLFTLIETAHNSVDNMPADPPAALEGTILPTSCFNSSDGEIHLANDVLTSNNGSVSFNGSSSYMFLNKSYTDLCSSFSVAAWVKTTSGGSILSFDNSKYYQLGISGGQVKLTTRETGAGSNTNVLAATPTVGDGAWHLVVATYGGSTYNIYIDGVLAVTQGGGASIGEIGDTRFGMIGASTSNVTSIATEPVPAGSYFSGQIAQLAIWNSSLSQADVTSMFTGGISGGTDHWVLNDAPHDGVLTDAYNITNPSAWARYKNVSLETGQYASPKFYSWKKDLGGSFTDLADITLDITDLDTGTYVLYVKDIFGCGTVSGTYKVDNGDTEEPLLLWNAAIDKPATNSNGADASDVTDGHFSTSVATSTASGAWLDINLENSFPVNMVRIHPSSPVNDVYIIVSPSPFGGASTLTADTTGMEWVYLSSVTGVGQGIFDLTANYVRIRTTGTTLDMNEVEVLTSYPTPTIRKLYITDNVSPSCGYEITADDVTIDPVAFDECGGTITVSNDYPDIAHQVSLVGLDWPNNTSYTVTWTAVDSKGLPKNLTMTYEVVDEEPPTFVYNPFTDVVPPVPTVMTYCDAQGFIFPIAKVTDNFTCGDTIQSLELYIDDNFLVYSQDMATYDIVTPGSLPSAIPDDMQPGSHKFEWRVFDLSNNSDTVYHTILIQAQPLVKEVKVLPNSCSGDNNATVYFSDIAYEIGQPVVYLLRPLPIGSGTDIPYTPGNVVPVGTYKALISVNGCQSNLYNEDIVISSPAAIALNEEITHVRCYGEESGAIDINPSGGSGTNILHIEGETVSAGGYSALALDTAGMVECWIFLDSLAGSDGMNDDASFIDIGGACGLSLVNGALQFHAGADFATVAAGAIQQRQWYHIAGSYSWSNVTGSGTITLYIGGGSVSSGALTANPFVAAGGITIGGGLNGFVRNARVWNAFPANFVTNIDLVSPIDPGNNLVADFPINETGGAGVSNAALVSGATSGSFSGAGTRQNFAYYWVDANGNTLTDGSGTFISFNEDIIDQPTGNYFVTLFDPIGCSAPSDPLLIEMGDDEPPTMTFYVDREHNQSLGVGVPITRETEDISGGGNVVDDCYYFPYSFVNTLPDPDSVYVSEFDPVVTDGDCPADAVDVSYTVLSGSFGIPSPLAGNDSTLNGVGMTGIMQLRWTAVDPAGIPATRDVTYYILDTKNPVLTRADSTVYIDNGFCTYTVKTVSELLPVLTDNCPLTTGRLYNNKNNADTLKGVSFLPGTHKIRWTYEDQSYPDLGVQSDPATIEFTLNVVDNQGPVVPGPGTFTVDLDASGNATLESLSLDPTSATIDNCNTITALHVTKNIADGLTPVAGVLASPVYANSTIDLGGSNTIYGVNVTGTTTSGYWVLVSNSGAFTNSGGWTTADTAFAADVVYAQYFAGTDNFFAFTHAAIGQYVRIQATNGAAVDGTVEVYGATAPGTTLALDCDDVRYVSGIYPAQVWNSIGVLLTAIDNHGNTGSKLWAVTVRDRIPPVIVPSANPTVKLSDAAPGTVTVNAADLGTATDNCGTPITLSIDNPIFTCANIGSNPVVLHALDKNGNIADISAAVIIADSSPPNVYVNSNIQLPLGPDGYYDVQPTDIFSSVDDNCTDVDDLFYTYSPDQRVVCSQRGPINFSVTVTDGSGQSTTVTFLAADPDPSKRIQVVDLLPPVASVNSFELTIPVTGHDTIKFEDIIPYKNLYDNCDKYNVPVRQIRYDASCVSNCSWCDAGNEGTGGTNASTNIALNADNTVSASSGSFYGSPTPTYQPSNARDNSIPGVYISSDYTGDRYVEYNFGSNIYDIDSIQVRWHNESFYSSGSISNGGTYLTASNVISSNENSSYPDGNCRDGDGGTNYGNEYRTTTESGGQNTTVDSITVEYNFTDTMVFENTRIRWSNRPEGSGNTYLPKVQIFNGSVWVNVGTFSNAANNTNYNLDISPDVTGKRIRVVFDRRRNNYVGISEWIVYGRPKGYNCELPTTAYLEYNSGAWSATTYNVTCNATPSDNSLKQSISSVNALRLHFTGTNGYVGIKEWRVYGKVHGAASACVQFSCADVNKDVPVFLQWADNVGTKDSTRVTVHVVSYFDILEVNVKDCGFGGEAYYPIVSNLDLTGHIYTYNWGTRADNASVCAPYYTNSYTSSFTNPSTTSLAYPKCANSTSYKLYLKVTDNNAPAGCWDSIDFNYDWDRVADAATNTKDWQNCVGDTQTFKVLFPTKWEFWRDECNQFIWTWNNTWFERIDGGLSATFTSGRTLADWPYTGWPYFEPRPSIADVGGTGSTYITGILKTPTSANGVTTDVKYSWKGLKLDSGISSPTGTIYTASSTTVAGNVLVITDSLDTGGPYFTESTVRVSPTNMVVGVTKYVLMSSSGTQDWHYDDYDLCLEKNTYKDSVFAVERPVVEAQPLGESTWYSPTAIDICTRDSVWYRVSNANIYAYLDWDIMRYTAIDTIATGRRLDKGNWYNDSILIVWDQYPELPRLTVKGYNVLDCFEDTVIQYAGYEGSGYPWLQGNATAAVNDCSELDTTHFVSPGACSFTFQNLPPPLMFDDCKDRIKDYYYKIGTTKYGKNAAGTYDLGTTDIVWYAVDYNDLTSDGTCVQHITVEDNEPPHFASYPTDTTLTANPALDGNCDQTFHGASTTRRDVTAWDNCTKVGSNIKIYAEFDYLDDGSWEDEEDQMITSLDFLTSNYTFETGPTRVRWIARDTVDPVHNRDTIDFLVIVEDKTKPVFDQDPSTPLIIDPLTAHVGVADLNSCTKTFTAAELPLPTGAVMEDNCSDDAYLESHVIFVSRTDGKANLLDPYPVGNTTITWRVTDEAGLWQTATQAIAITDTQHPTFDPADVYLHDTIISFCNRNKFRLGIPVPDDNCQVDTIFWRVETLSGGTLIDKDTIAFADSPDFDPNGTGLTRVVAALPVPPTTGADFKIIWTVKDKYGLTNLNAAPVVNYEYKLHVEMEPMFSTAQITPMTCGGADDAAIKVDTSANSLTYYFDRLNPDNQPYFSIDNGASWGAKQQITFGGLRGGTYNLRMMVNGCVSSQTSVVKVITEPTPYTLTSSKVDVTCYEDSSGSIELIMGGGVPGQVHFVGSGVTAANYSALDIATGSIAAWVYLDHQGAGSIVSSANYELKINNSSRVVLSVNGSDLVTSADTLMAERWYYIVGTWDASSSQVAFTSGSLVSVTSGSGATANDGNSSVTMGGFAGILRNVSIWKNVIGTGIPSVKYTGTETDLVGYWELANNAGTSAKNSVSGGTDATGVAGWQPNLPQPGTYTWNKDGSLYGYQVNLSDLKVGKYNVLFVDQYNCPDPSTDALIATDSIGATDKVAPVIQDLFNLPIAANYGGCDYTFERMDTVNLFAPTIIDANQCNYDVVWKIVTDHNQAEWIDTISIYPKTPKIDNKFLGQSVGRYRLNGINTVTVKAIQNVNVTSTEVYTITVLDTLEPDAKVKFSSLTAINLNQYGEAKYAATDFNDNSSDFCSQRLNMTYWVRTSESEAWADSIILDCDNIGDVVTVYFKVIDESGNADSTVGSGTLNVVDVTPPKFILNSGIPRGPYCANNNAVGGIPAYSSGAVDLSEIELFAADYFDNCGVTRIRYKLTHESYNPVGYNDWHEVVGMDFNPAIIQFLPNLYEGKTTVTFEIADGADSPTPPRARLTAEKDIFVITVLPKPHPGGIN